jgi:hypothetical protein
VNESGGGWEDAAAAPRESEREGGGTMTVLHARDIPFGKKKMNKKNDNDNRSRERRPTKKKKLRESRIKTENVNATTQSHTPRTDK